MSTKIDYVAMYTPIVKVLENKNLTEKQRLELALDIMKETIKEAKND